MKVQLLLLKTEIGLIPVEDEAVQAVSKIKNGEHIIVEYKKHRNVKNHKRLFNMLNMVVQNSPEYATTDNLLSVCKLKAGHFETVVSHKGDVLYIPKSINFASLGEDEFQKFFSSAIDTCLEFCSEDMMNDIVRYA